MLKSNFFRIIPIVLIVGLFVSCSDDQDSTDPVNQNLGISIRYAQRGVGMDLIASNIYLLIETGISEVVEEENFIDEFFQYYPCVNITHNPNGDNGELILDFGEECKLYGSSDKANLSGQIVIEYISTTNTSKTINYSFVDFAYIGRSVTGSGTITRTFLSNNTLVRSTMSESLQIANVGEDPNLTATLNDSVTMEWYNGVGDGLHGTNNYRYFGERTVSYSDGITRSSQILQPYRRINGCPYFIEGVINFTQEGESGQITVAGGNACTGTIQIMVNDQIRSVSILF